MEPKSSLPKDSQIEDQPNASTANVPAPSPRSLFSSFLLVAATIVTAVLMFSWFGRWVYLAELMGNFQLQLGLFGLAFPILLWIRRKYTWALLMMLVVSATLYNPLVSLWPTGQIAPQPSQLRLMSYNVYAGNRNPDQVREIILENHPDIFALIEYTPSMSVLEAQLHDQYPFQLTIPRNHGFGIALFSRVPFESEQVVYLTQTPTEQDAMPPFSNKADPALVVVIADGEKRLQIVATHLFNPIEPPMFPVRNEQMRRLVDLTNATKHPTVIMGDFNCTPWSGFFRDMLKSTGLRDSRQGFGYQGSWPSQGNFLSIPIDHFLIAPSIRVEHRWVGPAGGSDHFSVHADLSW